jgi:sigma-B regulation protein RsbU (phosphoserine phosphatase)
MNRTWRLLLWLVIAAAGSLQAQTYDLTSDRMPVAYLSGLWRFHTGDDPGWAASEFNDSHWSLLRSDKLWSVAPGYEGYSGLAWYRFKVKIPARYDRISLDLPHILTCYEVYADGKLLGAYGKMPPNPVPYSGGFNMIYELPRSPHVDRTVTFAIRVWHWQAFSPFYGGGPLYGGGLVGKTDDVKAMDEQLRGDRHWAFSSTLLLALLQTLAAVGALALFLLRRSDREYLWFSLVLLSSACVSWLALSYYFNVWPVIPHNQIEAALLGPCINLAEIAFYTTLLKGRRTLLFWVAVGASLLSIFYNFIFGMEGSNTAAWYAGQDLLMLPVFVWILALLFQRANKNFEDARLLLAPVVLQKASLLFQQVSILTFTLGWQQRFDFRIRLTDWPFRIELVQVVDVLFLMTMLAILILRFTRTRRHEESYAIEVEGARSVQQFLIPQQMPHIDGLVFHSEYRPAREVGGDFFQIIPDRLDGSALIVVGDVTGKGLQAGMLATLIVGALRTAATFTTDPEQIMHTLNNRLCDRGVATCLAMRIEASGAVTMVNGGHIPPYLNGKELTIDGSLPLGIVPGIDFPVAHFALDDRDSLMLMSDGIAEAQNHEGHLFGFERVDELLRSSASATELADAAQSFGQSDDITVLEIERFRSPVAV